MSLETIYSKTKSKLKIEKAGMQDDVMYKKRVGNELYLIHLSYFRGIGTYVAMYISAGERVSRQDIHKYYNDTSRALKSLLRHMGQTNKIIKGYIVSTVGTLTLAGRGVNINRNSLVVGCDLTTTVDMEINEMESFLVANSWKKV